MKQKLLANFSKDAIEFIYNSAEISNNDGIIYLKEDRELEVNGHLYDIISISKKGNSSIFKCVADIKETSLKSRLKLHLKNYFTRDSSTKNLAYQIIGFFSSLFHVESKNHAFQSDSISHQEKLSFHYSFHYIIHHANSDDRPPRS